MLPASITSITIAIALLLNTIAITIVLLVTNVDAMSSAASGGGGSSNHHYRRAHRAANTEHDRDPMIVRTRNGLVRGITQRSATGKEVSYFKKKKFSSL